MNGAGARNPPPVAAIARRPEIRRRTGAEGRPATRPGCVAPNGVPPLTTSGVNLSDARVPAATSDCNDTCAILDSALGDGRSVVQMRSTGSASPRRPTPQTLGDLQAWCPIYDRQCARATANGSLHPRVRRLGYPGGDVCVLVLLGIGIGWGLYGNTSSTPESYLRPAPSRRDRSGGADRPAPAATCWAD